MRFFGPTLDLVPAFDCFPAFLPGFRDDLPAMSLADKSILAIIAASFLILAARRLLSLPASPVSVAVKTDCQLLMALLSWAELSDLATRLALALDCAIFASASDSFIINTPEDFRLLFLWSFKKAHLKRCCLIIKNAYICTILKYQYKK